MYLDADLQFCSEQAITVDGISENVIDLAPLGGGNLIRDIAAGKQVGVLLNVVASLTDINGSPTLEVTVESDDAADLAGSATVHGVLVPALTAEAGLLAGTNFFMWLNPNQDYQRYLGLRFDVSTADFDGGTVDAWLVMNRQAARTYANNSPNSA
jgi:hypothetical protein